MSVIGQEGRVAILNKMVRVVFVKKVMCEWRREGGEGTCHADNRKENAAEKGRVCAKTLRRGHEAWRVQE